MLSVAFSYCYECHNSKCRYAECRYAECCYAECRGALGTTSLKSFSILSQPQLVFIL
jgi:hypothetical protein